MRVEFLLEHLQVGEMTIRNGNPLGHEHRGAAVKGLKDKHHARRKVGCSGGFQ